MAPAAGAPLDDPVVCVRATSEELGLDFALTVPVKSTRVDSISNMLADLAIAIGNGTALDMKQLADADSFTATVQHRIQLRTEQHEFYNQVKQRYEHISATIQQLKRDYYREIDQLRDQLQAKQRDPKFKVEDVSFFDPYAYKIPTWEEIAEYLDSKRMRRELEAQQGGPGLRRVPMFMLCRTCRTKFDSMDSAREMELEDEGTQTDERAAAVCEEVQTDGSGRPQVRSLWVQTDAWGPSDGLPLGAATQPALAEAKSVGVQAGAEGVPAADPIGSFWISDGLGAYDGSEPDSLHASSGDEEDAVSGWSSARSRRERGSAGAAGAAAVAEQGLATVELGASGMGAARGAAAGRSKPEAGVAGAGGGLGGAGPARAALGGRGRGEPHGARAGRGARTEPDGGDVGGAGGDEQQMQLKQFAGMDREALEGAHRRSAKIACALRKLAQRMQGPTTSMRIAFRRLKWHASGTGLSVAQRKKLAAKMLERRLAALQAHLQRSALARMQSGARDEWRRAERPVAATPGNSPLKPAVTVSSPPPPQGRGSPAPARSQPARRRSGQGEWRSRAEARPRGPVVSGYGPARGGAVGREGPREGHEAAREDGAAARHVRKGLSITPPPGRVQSAPSLSPELVGAPRALPKPMNFAEWMGAKGRFGEPDVEIALPRILTPASETQSLTGMVGKQMFPSLLVTRPLRFSCS